MWKKLLSIHASDIDSILMHEHFQCVLTNYLYYLYRIHTNCKSKPPLYVLLAYGPQVLSFYHIPFPWKGRGQHAVIKLVGWDGGDGGGAYKSELSLVSMNRSQGV